MITIDEQDIEIEFAKKNSKIGEIAVKREENTIICKNLAVSKNIGDTASEEELHQQPSIRLIFHNRESLDGFINELKSIKLRY